MTEQLGIQFNTNVERQACFHDIFGSALDTLTQGFIMMKKNHIPIHSDYRNLGVQINVLNAVRYEIAFSIDDPMMTNDIDWNLVNSIMKPRFPNTYLFYIKIP